jgi:hypothetical protein
VPTEEELERERGRAADRERAAQREARLAEANATAESPLNKFARVWGDDDE